MGTVDPWELHQYYTSLPKHDLWDCYRTAEKRPGVVWGVNVGIYGSFMECLGYTSFGNQTHCSDILPLPLPTFRTTTLPCSATASRAHFACEHRRC